MYKTIIVIDDDIQTQNIDLNPLAQSTGLELVPFSSYLEAYPKLNEPKTRIINLCNTEHYLSRGYYCSLLAEARQHRVLPSVSTINSLRELDRDELTFINLNQLPSELKDGEQQDLMIYFGWCENESWRKIIRLLFERFSTPLLRFNIEKKQGAIHYSLTRVALQTLSAHEFELFVTQLKRFTDKVWRQPNLKQKYRWDMAILVNPEEPNPPSDKEAIQRFIKAAAKTGINAEIIHPHQASLISQYDALFIRETTAIDHHTYRLARKAEQEGLVVVDDPTSILRCCNKVFLHDAFTYNKVPSLKTQVVSSCSNDVLNNLENIFNYPMILKVPEGSFSKGVYKIENRNELQQKIETLLKSSALLLIQEYLYTEYDWRIGVLNGRAIYACRYYMARNHWQIYNHDSKRFNSGDFETLPTFEAPKAVLDAALKACKIIGKGLYGVDLKQKDRQVYVIEVNDNPSLDHGIEDNYLGNELYMQIMQEFALRLEQRGRKL